jgi:hypothetical protein
MGFTCPQRCTWQQWCFFRTSHHQAEMHYRRTLTAMWHLRWLALVLVKLVEAGIAWYSSTS